MIATVNVLTFMTLNTFPSTPTMSICMVCMVLFCLAVLVYSLFKLQGPKHCLALSPNVHVRIVNVYRTACRVPDHTTRSDWTANTLALRKRDKQRCNCDPEAERVARTLQRRLSCSVFTSLLTTLAGQLSKSAQRFVRRRLEYIYLNISITIRSAISDSQITNASDRTLQTREFSANA